MLNSKFTDDGRQEIANAHFDFDQVSYRRDNLIIIFLKTFWFSL
jgi:hypothetical protein